MISGSDIDPEALKLSEKHIHQAGLDGLVSVFPCPLQDLLCEGQTAYSSAIRPTESA